MTFYLDGASVGSHDRVSESDVSHPLAAHHDPLGLVSKVDEILHRGKFTPQGSKLPLVEWAKNVSKAPLAFNPGDHYLYGLNTDVVGALVEVISGQPLDEFLHERIFQPLGMVDTSFWVPEEKYDRFSSLWMPADAAAYMAATSPSSSATATARRAPVRVATSPAHRTASRTHSISESEDRAWVDSSQVLEEAVR